MKRLFGFLFIFVPVLPLVVHAELKDEDLGILDWTHRHADRYPDRFTEIAKIKLEVDSRTFYEQVLARDNEDVLRLVEGWDPSMRRRAGIVQTRPNFASKAELQKWGMVDPKLKNLLRRYIVKKLLVLKIYMSEDEVEKIVEALMRGESFETLVGSNSSNSSNQSGERVGLMETLEKLDQAKDAGEHQEAIAQLDRAVSDLVVSDGGAAHAWSGMPEGAAALAQGVNLHEMASETSWSSSGAASDASDSSTRSFSMASASGGPDSEGDLFSDALRSTTGLEGLSFANPDESTAFFKDQGFIPERLVASLDPSYFGDSGSTLSDSTRKYADSLGGAVSSIDTPVHGVGSTKGESAGAVASSGQSTTEPESSSGKTSSVANSDFFNKPIAETHPEGSTTAPSGTPSGDVGGIKSNEPEVSKAIPLTKEELADLDRKRNAPESKTSASTTPPSTDVNSATMTTGKVPPPESFEIVTRSLADGQGIKEGSPEYKNFSQERWEDYQTQVGMREEVANFRLPQGAKVQTASIRKNSEASSTPSAPSAGESSDSCKREDVKRLVDSMIATRISESKASAVDARSALMSNLDFCDSIARSVDKVGEKNVTIANLADLDKRIFNEAFSAAASENYDIANEEGGATVAATERPPSAFDACLQKAVSSPDGRIVNESSMQVMYGLDSLSSETALADFQMSLKNNLSDLLSDEDKALFCKMLDAQGSHFDISGFAISTGNEAMTLVQAKVDYITLSTFESKLDKYGKTCDLGTSEKMLSAWSSMVARPIPNIDSADLPLKYLSTQNVLAQSMMRGLRQRNGHGERLDRTLRPLSCVDLRESSLGEVFKSHNSIANINDNIIGILGSGGLSDSPRPLERNAAISTKMITLTQAIVTAGKTDIGIAGEQPVVQHRAVAADQVPPTPSAQ